MAYINECGEEILGEFMERTDDDEARWILIRTRENSIDRRVFGYQYELKLTNAEGTQSWVAGKFTRESLAKFSEMLAAVVAEEETSGCV